MLKLIAEMYTEMRIPAPAFNGAKVSSLARKHLILYSDLGRRYLESRMHLDEGWLMWRWYPKHHLFSPFEAKVATAGSPADCWCYADESAIGEAIVLAETCHSSTLHRLVIEKHRL